VSHAKLVHCLRQTVPSTRLAVARAPVSVGRTKLRQPCFHLVQVSKRAGVMTGDAGMISPGVFESVRLKLTTTDQKLM